MGVQMSFKRAGAVLVVALLASSMGVLPAQAVAHSNDVDGIHITTSTKITTRAQLNAFLLSDAPKTVTIDATSGDMLAVTSGLPALDLPTVAPLISVSNTCTTSTSCMLSGMVPYAHFGFSGTGTATGGWPYRSGFRTGSHAAGGYYTLNGSTVCFGPCKMGPNSQVNFQAGQTATGVKVINYT